MRVADRVTDRMQTRRLESKRDSLDRDNERLRTQLDRDNERLRAQLRSTRQELEQERTVRDELLDALKRGTGGTTMKADTVKVKTKRRGGLLRLLVVGGGAYVLGTKAGRERYDQLKGFASGMKDRMRADAETEDDWATMTNGGTSGAASGTSGSPTGAGSTSAGSISAGSTSTGSTSTGSSPTGSTTTGSTPKRGGSTSPS